MCDRFRDGRDLFWRLENRLHDRRIVLFDEAHGGQFLLNLCVVRIELNGFTQGGQRLRSTALLRVEIRNTEKHSSDRLRLAALEERLSGHPLRIDAGVGELPEPNHAIDGAVFVACRASILDQPVVVRTRVQRQAVPPGDVRQLPQRVVVVASDLERLLIDSRCARKEPLAVQMVSRAVELLRRAIDRGFRYFDFTIGDEPYKRDWADSKLVLYDYLAGDTVRGWLVASAVRCARKAKRVIKQTPLLWRLAVNVRALNGRLARRPQAERDESP